MIRKQINILLSGKEYAFSERNREDTDFARYHQKIREQNLSLIQSSVKDKDNQLALMMAEMRRVYNGAEISIFISSNDDEIKRIAFDSFKINNPEISFDQFKQICTVEDARKVMLLIDELESEGDKKKVAEHQ